MTLLKYLRVYRVSCLIDRTFTIQLSLQKSLESSTDLPGVRGRSIIVSLSYGFKTQNPCFKEEEKKNFRLESTPETI